MKALLLISILFSVGSPTSDQILPTKLRVTVIDGLGNFVEGASVTIYSSKEDYQVGQNSVDSASTDSKGRVTFKDVVLIPYYIEVKKGEMNNNGEGVLTGKLSEGKINKVNTVIE